MSATTTTTIDRLGTYLKLRPGLLLAAYDIIIMFVHLFHYHRHMEGMADWDRASKQIQTQQN